MVKKHMTFKVFLIIFFAYILFSKNTYATNETFEYTNEKNNEKIITDSVVSVFEYPKLDFTDIDKCNIFYSKLNPIVLGIDSKSRFSLNEYMALEVDNQKSTQECWAFSIFNSMETNLFIKKQIKIDFSERHMDYSTSNSISGNDVEMKYSRPASTGAVTEVGMAYLTNGQGAVLEKEMKFENNMNNVKYSDLNIKPSYYVSDYIQFPNILKTYDSDGNVKYYNSYGKEYDECEIGYIRNQIKRYILENGALVSVMPSKYTKGYNNTDDVTKATAFCCKDLTQNRDHAITIVGWDDNYSRENFNEANRPKSNGAYIVLQSYGEHFFEKGYIYISYEDCLIESSIYGICNSDKYDYDNLYQNDFYGADGTMHLKDCQVGYLSTYFTRDKSKTESLTKVSVNIPQRASIEVWVNPNSDDISEKNLIKISDKSEILEPGYHTIDVEKTKLTGEKFAIVIKQISENGDFYFNVEYCNSNTLFYKNVSSEPGRNKVSIDGKVWEALEEQGKDTKSEKNLLTADLCIKAFTCEETNENKK